MTMPNALHTRQPLKQADIIIGGRYTAKVSGKIVAVRVRDIDTVFLQRGNGKPRKTTRYYCINEATGNQICVKSAQRFRARLGQPISEIWG